jgi:hypothetical protein
MFRKACLPDIRYKDTKNGKSLDRIYKKVSIKYRNKKRASSSEPLASCKKSPKAFLFLLASNFCYLKINLSFYL